MIDGQLCNVSLILLTLLRASEHRANATSRCAAVCTNEFHYDSCNYLLYNCLSETEQGHIHPLSKVRQDNFLIHYSMMRSVLMMCLIASCFALPCMCSCRPRSRARPINPEISKR